MAISRHFDKKLHFAYTKCVGSIDDHQLHLHVLSFQVESKELFRVREILDFRRVTRADRLSVQGMIEITDLEKKRSKDRDFRLAILVSRSLTEKMAHFYAQIIRTPNLRVHVFQRDVKEALTWLGYTPQEVEYLHRFIRQRSKVD